MFEISPTGVPMSRRAQWGAAEALFRARRAEIVAVVVQQAEAGNRAAIGLAREYGLPVEPAPDVLAARMAESIERTRATVAALLAEGGLDIGKDSRSPGPAGRARHATTAAVTTVNNNQNTSAAEDGHAGG